MKKKKTISKEDFLNYLQSEKGASRHKVEREALSDPFLQEAMEGFEEWNNPSASVTALEELDRRLRPSENRWRIFGAAASVLLLLGLTLFWVKDLSKETTDLAVKTEQKKSESGLNSDTLSEVLNPAITHPVTPSDAYIEPERKHATGTTNIQKNKAVSQAREQGNAFRLSDEAVPAPLLEEMEDATLVSPVEESSVQESELNAISLGEAKKDQAYIQVESEAREKAKGGSIDRRSKKVETQKRERAAPSSSAPMESTYDSKGPSINEIAEAKRLYENKEFQKSLIICSAIVSTRPGDSEALYYSGLNERAMGNPKKALEYFEKVSKLSIFYYNSRWNMYELLTSDVAKSKAILTELASEPNEYQDKAKKLLSP